MKNKGIVFGMALTGLLILMAAVFLLWNVDNGEYMINVNLYFQKLGTTVITEEKREIIYDDATEIIPKIIKEINKGPLSPDKERIVPKGVKLKSISYTNDESAVIDLNNNFLSDDESYNLLCAYAVIKSVCYASSITGINYVKLTVDGEEIKTHDGKSVGFLSYNDITLSDTENENKTFETLIYYSYKDSDTLAAEIRNLPEDNTKTKEQIIVEELLAGPKSDKLKKTIDGEIISVETKDGICFVNFKSTFLEKNKDKDIALLSGSLVNSLTELSYIDGVQILVDGKKVESFKDILQKNS